jgi:hypothetical protein
MPDFSTKKQRLSVQSEQLVPDEVVMCIFDFLDNRSLVCCLRVSKQWNQVASNNTFVSNLSTDTNPVFSGRFVTCQHFQIQ